jgi:hypothetical protein
MKIFLKTLFSFILFWALVLGTAACQLVPSEPTSEGPTPAPVQVTGIVLVPPTLTPRSGTITAARPNQTITIIPTGQPSPTRTPTQIRLPVTMLGTPTQIQVKTQVSIFFNVKNPNSELTISSVPYKITAFDESGIEINSHSTYIYMIFPNESRPVVDTFTVKSGQTVAKVDIKLDSPRFEAPPFRAPVFISEQATFYANTNPIVTAIIKSKNDDGFYDLKVTAILYDANETIVGGGYAYLNFLPGDSRAAVKIYVQSTAIPARIELSSSLTSISFFSSRNNIAQPALELLDYGFSQTNTTVSAAIVAQNILGDQTLERSQYQIALYDANDNVLDCVQGYFDLFFPGEKMGTTAIFYLNKAQKAARIEAQVMSGVRSDHVITANPFQVGSIQYLPGTVAKASTILKSTYPQNLTNVEINIVAYDQNDKVIGGGRRYADLIPANGQAEVEVPLYLAQTPARLELYAGITSITKIGK